MRREHRSSTLGSLVLLAGLALAGTPSATAAPGAVVAPDRVTKAQSEIHQLESTAGRPYTLFRYAVPETGSVPHILAIDDDDHVWFSESGGRFAKNFIDAPPQGRLGRLDKNGTISEWQLTGAETSPMGIIFDDQKNLWISERLGNRITRRSPTGELVSWEIPTPGAWPTGIDIDSKGRVWFTETKGDKIGVIDPASGELKEYALPAVKTMTTGIAIDHQDRIWVAERDVNTIAVFEPKTETFTQYPLSTPEAKPCALVVTADGSVWFSQRGGGKIGRVEPDGTIREYLVPDRFSGPFFLVTDRRGDL
ncbi:MAG: hypothetical protein KDD11_23085, partial [Acidobacteria bacterium]|nr:hypothetical protein [Acidobacteriota bacterium]